MTQPWVLVLAIGNTSVLVYWLWLLATRLCWCTGIGLTMAPDEGTISPSTVAGPMLALKNEAPLTVVFKLWVNDGPTHAFRP